MEEERTEKWIVLRAAHTKPPFELGSDRIAIVAPNATLGELVQRDHRDKPWVKVIWPGSALTGWRFAMVLISGSVLNDILRGGPETHKIWWNEYVKCKLVVDGQIIVTP